jgi:anaerobic selenocysteine-containing dehydrogenase
VHPDDAEARGLSDGDPARVASKSGAVEVPILITEDMTPGTVALPHGWGHRGGWSVANAAGGVNVNLLSSSAPEDLEPLAGMAFLNGIPVSLEPAGSGEPEPSPRADGVPAATPPSAA